MNLKVSTEPQQSQGRAELRLIFMNKKFTGQFLISENEDGILGRDILNHLKLLFDGKNLEWSEAS
jgi:hypothetical protein